MAAPKMTDLLVAAVVAPVIVVPLCQVSTLAVRWVVTCHRALSWPARLVILGFLIGAAVNGLRVWP